MSTRLLSAAELAACRAVIAGHSRSFYLASRLLPCEVREAAWALYAFCRVSDDAVDHAAHADAALEAVEALRDRLEAIYAGRPGSLLDRAFLTVVERFALPRRLPETLLEGLESDARRVVFVSEAELLGYCFRVASTVGLMLTRVMGGDRPAAYLRAADLGLAMQLSNIARDLGEDARLGRLYAPLSWLEELGIERAAFLRDPRPDPAVRRLAARLLDLAERHYRASEPGIALLPGSCRLAIAASRCLYAAIGEAIERNGHDAISRRAFVPWSGRLGALAQAAALALRPPAPDLEGPADALLGPWIEAVDLPVVRPGLPLEPLAPGIFGRGEEYL